jgi:hypothetical protein
MFICFISTTCKIGICHSLFVFSSYKQPLHLHPSSMSYYYDNQINNMTFSKKPCSARLL